MNVNENLSDPNEMSFELKNGERTNSDYWCGLKKIKMKGDGIQKYEKYDFNKDLINDELVHKIENK